MRDGLPELRGTTPAGAAGPGRLARGVCRLDNGARTRKYGGKGDTAGRACGMGAWWVGSKAGPGTEEAGPDEARAAATGHGVGGETRISRDRVRKDSTRTCRAPRPRDEVTVT